MVCTGLETNNALKTKTKKPTTLLFLQLVFGLPSFIKVRVSFNYELTQPLITFREREVDQYS